MAQSANKHIRLSKIYHFTFLPIAFASFSGAAWYLFRCWQADADLKMPVYYLLTSIAVIGAGVVGRYSGLKVQDRIIRTEENFRHFRMTGQVLDPRIRTSQIIALRFASDEEFADLAKRTAEEGLSPVVIKSLIKNWRADHRRV